MAGKDIPPLGERRAYQFKNVLTLAYNSPNLDSASLNAICNAIMQTFHLDYWHTSDKNLFAREVRQAITDLADKGYLESSTIERDGTDVQSGSVKVFRITNEGWYAYRALNNPKHGSKVLDWIIQNGVPVARQVRTILITYRLMVIASWIGRVRLGHVRRVRYPNTLPPTEVPPSVNDKAMQMVSMRLPSTETAGPSRRRDRMVTPWLLPLMALTIYVAATISEFRIDHTEIATTAKVMAIFAGAGAALGAVTVSVLVWYRANSVYQAHDPEPEELRGQGSLTVGVPYRETLRRWFFRTTDAPIHYRVFMNVGAVSGVVLYWVFRLQGVVIP